MLADDGPESNAALEVILMIGFIVQVVSAIASLIIIIISFVLNFHKEQIGKMIIIFSFMQTIYASPLHQFIEGSFMCKIVDYLSCYSLVSVSIWSACFTHHLMVALNNTKYNTKSLLLKYLLIAQGIPCIFAIMSILLEFNKWDEADASCLHLLRTGTFDTPLLVTRLIPVFVSMACAITFYVISLREVRIVQEFMKRTKTDGSIRILIIIPLINTIVWIPMLVMLILVAAQARVNDILLNSICLGTLGQGLITSIAIGCSGKVRAGIRKRSSTQNSSLHSSQAGEEGSERKLTGHSLQRYHTTTTHNDIHTPLTKSKTQEY